MTKDEQMVLAALEGAQEVLREYGWHQMSYGDVRRGFCLMGAIDQAAMKNKVPNLSRTSMTAFSEVQEVLGIDPDDPDCRISVSSWNDEKGRTKQQVQGLLKRTVTHFKKKVQA